MFSEKKHWFFVYATYENLADNSLNKTDGEFSLPSNKVTKTLKEGIKNDLIAIVKSKNPEVIINNFQLISLSYLGEMTVDEFNS